MITFSLLTIIQILAAALALFDGASRLRGRKTNSLLAIAELVFAVLMLLAIFNFLAPYLQIFAIILEVVLILILVFRGSGRKGVSTITILALVLNTIVVVISLGWIAIPGIA
jgi:O-antigen ligase